jgi:VCBS repeat-containing protein
MPNTRDGTVTLYAQWTDAVAPVITGPSSATGATSSISISENSTSVHTFTANESVTWSKSGTDESFFSISAGGVVTITSRNFESPADSGGDNTYVFIVTATDAALNAKNQTVTVTITNVNEAPVITINSSNATHAITQAENSTSVITYTATDVDAGATLSFSISGTDAADFAINSSSGVLIFASAPDFEAPADSDINNQYIVEIIVFDGSLSDTQTLTVTITNANESASINAPTVSGNVNKGISTTISVTLNAAGKVRFSVGGKRISNCLAKSTTGSYPNFTATCSWKPPVTGNQNLTARVTPSDGSFSATTSPSTSVLVTKRANSR